MKAVISKQTGSSGTVLQGAVCWAALLLSSSVFADSPALVYHQLRPGVGESEIQRALDALPDTGGIVVLPPGNITVTRPLLVKRSNQTLRGAGTTTPAGGRGAAELAGLRALGQGGPSSDGATRRSGRATGLGTSEAGRELTRTAALRNSSRDRHGGARPRGANVFFVLIRGGAHVRRFLHHGGGA